MLADKFHVGSVILREFRRYQVECKHIVTLHLTFRTGQTPLGPLSPNQHNDKSLQWNLTNTVTTGMGKNYLNGEVTVLQGVNLLVALWNTIWD